MKFKKPSLKNPILHALVTALMATASTQITQAVPYASGISNNAGTVSFVLNEAADSVKVLFNSGSTTNDLGPLSKGVHSFALGAATNYQIEVSKTGPLGWTQTSADTNVFNQMYSARGLAVNLNPTNTAIFGRIYIANALNNTTTITGSRTTGKGIYLLNADQSDALGRGNTASTAGITFDTATATGAGDSSPWRLAIGPDNYLYICDYSINTGTLYRTDPDVTTNIMVLEGQGNTGNPAVHTTIGGVIPMGSLENGDLTILGIDGNIPGGFNATLRWDIGAGPLPASPPPAFLTAARLGVAHLQTEIDMGPDGKLYYLINRSAGTDTDSIRVYDTNSTPFTLLWGSLTQGGNPDPLRQARSLKVSPDGSTLAIIRDDNTTLIVPLINGIPDLAGIYTLATYPTTPTAGRSVTWDAAGNLYVISSGREVMRVFSPGGTTVAITGDDGSGTNGTFSIIKQPVPDPSIAIQPQNVTVNAGVNATFTVSAIGTTPFSYQWRYAGTNIAGATLSTYTRTAAQTNFAGDYQVVVSNSVGAVTSSVAVLTVTATAPIITTQPTGYTNAAGTSKTFTVATTGSDPRSYQWRFNGTNLAGSTGTSLARANAQTNHSGTYSVVISNYLGSVTSSVVNMVITNSAPVFNAQPKSQTVNAGVNVTFTLSLTQASSNNLAYQWKIGGVPIVGATNTSYVTNNVQAVNSGEVYSVTVTNLFGSITSTNAILTVVDTQPILAVQPRSQTNGVGSNIVFSVTTSAASDPKTYQWQFEGVDILDATNSTLTLTNLQFSNAGNYSVIVANAFGVAPSTNAVLTLTNRAPIITAAPASVSTNAGSAVSFTISANGQTNLTYQWSRAGVDIPGGTDATLNLNNVQLSDAGFYTVVVGSGAGTFFTTNSAAQLAVTIPSTPGTGTGLRGDYYTTQNQTFTNAPTLTRIDTNIDFVFGTGSPDPSISADRFTVRWTGQVQPLYSQDYIFYTRSDDGARLWVNGKLLVNRWVGQSVTEVASAPITLTAGQKYDLMMEYFEGTSVAEVHLLWSSTSQIKTAIPMAQLYPAALNSAITPNLKSTFNGTSAVFDWTGTFTLQTSANVDGPYTNLTGLVTGPYTNTLTSDPQRYFRLKAN